MSDRFSQNLGDRTDLRQIFMVSRTMAENDQSKISLSISQGRCHGSRFLLVLSTELIFGDTR